MRDHKGSFRLFPELGLYKLFSNALDLFVLLNGKDSGAKIPQLRLLRNSPLRKQGGTIWQLAHYHYGPQRPHAESA